MRALGTMVGIAAVVASVLTGCAPPATEPDEAGPSATLQVHAGSATIESGDSAAPSVAPASGTEVAPGDVVTTVGDDAMIDIAWSDGAVTRLGPDTAFTVGDPAAVLGSRGEQRGGLTWNRAAADDDDYAIDVVGAGRTRDRGELFVVDCRADPCRVLASGGLGGDGSVTSVRRTGVETVVDSSRLATWSSLMSDEWARLSNELDVKAGLTPVEDLFADADPSRGVLEGTFDVVRTGVESECTGSQCDALVLLQPGQVRNLEFVFHEDCDADGVCASRVDTQTINTSDGSIIDTTTDLVSGADTYTWGTDDTIAVCIWQYADGTTVDVGSARNAVRWEVRPTAAEVRDGRFMVTELRGRAWGSLETVEPPGAEFPGCEAYLLEWTGESDLVLTKRGD
jgi:hypothetical protein